MLMDRGTLANGRWVEVTGPLVRVGTTEAQEVQGVIDALRAAGLVVNRVGVVRPSLEELFMEAVGATGGVR
jgi:hypothetical protein